MTNNVKFEIVNQEFHIGIGKEDWQEIVINNELHLHITKSNEGYIVDYYAYTQGEERDDLITSTTIWEDDLTKYITVYTEGNDCTEDEYYLIGTKLYYDNELLSDNIESDKDIIRNIITSKDNIIRIELDDNEIYSK